MPVVFRRLVFLVLATTTIAGLLVLATLALSPGGLDAIDILLLVSFAGTTPWLVVGFWNAAIGFAVMRFARDPIAAVVPQAKGPFPPLASSTAIVMCIRNEPPERAARNVAAMLDELSEAGLGERFHFYVLSDTSLADVAAAEVQAFAGLAVTYRRRPVNTGFKAGNIRDFLERWGERHDFMLTLDADSFMSAPAMQRLIATMEASPTLGILQGLVIGMPTTSAFARLFQFGMRLGMRSWTIGSAWWQADCGPYWGHNAAIRIAPFKQHCAIPPLSGRGILGGHVLSHDQIEAALMRRAGYEVRVLPEEDLGWEENPPTLLEFLHRDQRWLQGTLQYVFFIAKPGLKPTSRFQLFFAMMMFLGSPAWIGVILVGTFALAAAPTTSAVIDPVYGAALLSAVLFMWFSAKIATTIDVLVRPSLRRAFGGGPWFLASVVAETAFFLMLSPIMWVCHTLFFAGLPFGRAIGWIGQARDDHAVAWPEAWRMLWPQTVLGGVSLGALALLQPAALPYMFVLLAGGLVLAVPYCVVTSWPRLGLRLAARGLGRLPEETEPPKSLQRLALPAFQARGTLRSLALYYGDPVRTQAMDTLYSRFIAPGDLVFDIGAHVGDRIAAFRRLGARIVALEPQPALHQVLRQLHASDPEVTLLAGAVGRSAGTATMRINSANPTISTLSSDFIAASRGAKGWEGEDWPQAIRVPVTTLDMLIASHGLPSFIKIDVEGFEAEALAGLTQPVAALSFEFTTIQREVALACLDRCTALGFTEFNIALGESQTLGLWRDAHGTAEWLKALPHAANSGDVYAVRKR